jgi:hypothetical protein
VIVAILAALRTALLAVHSSGLSGIEYDYPKFINKTDKCLISFRPNGRKCYNASAVRLALAG